MLRPIPPHAPPPSPAIPRPASGGSQAADAASGTPLPGAASDARLRAAAVQLEGAFLAEMLKTAGFARPREGLGGGGAGEAQFASLLADLQAERIAARGGIGLAEALFRALSAREAAHG